ncbi:hypothetical protein NDU88_002222 [Pleurodeles waltl]|uniref:Uncharacterized protein n=1 Tax=Pleurodeles waltl TaxID=8319 RepID=A0AAV7PEQ0_PLEWA|nr:hypothetical protein NDU88_002222 [Pleurodeles waltl]
MHTALARSSSENASGSRKNTGKKTEEIPYGKYLGCFLGFIVKWHVEEESVRHPCTMQQNKNPKRGVVVEINSAPRL